MRLTGEDVERGTFSHRHAVFHDARTGQRFTPLQALPQARAAFEIHNSPLSENAALGFEYGYNIQAPERLVIWEAQYGDFVNGAQVVIDEFIVSARSKWGVKPSLVMLLPHGLEGQGPDHASARPERFLQLAADVNLRLVNCTTAAQYFHVLRRQALLLHSDPLPLVILTPKSLLRHASTLSTPRELAHGHWQRVIEDAGARQRVKDVTRLALCSGKVYVDLAAFAPARGGGLPRRVAARAALPVPRAGRRGGRVGLPEPAGGRVAPGGAREHGRLGVAAAAADRAAAGRRPAARRRAAAQREPGRGLGGAPRDRAGRPHRGGVDGVIV